MKKYLIWTPKVINKYCFEHPNTGDKINTRWKGFIKMKQTGYGNTPTDGRMLGSIEYDENNIDNTTVNEFISQYKADFGFYITDEVYSNELLLKWYGLNKDGIQNITVKDFIFTNNIT